MQPECESWPDDVRVLVVSGRDNLCAVTDSITLWRFIDMPGKSYKTNEATNGACFDDDLLYRHLENMTTSEEEERIEQHLNECNHCFADLTALTEIVQTPITETERIEIARSRKISPEEQVEKILEYVEGERAATTVEQSEDEPLVIVDPPAVIRILLEIWRRHRIRILQYGVAFVVLLTGVAYLQISYNNAANRIQQAEDLLKNNYRVFYDATPRLAGGYESKGIGITMAPGDSVPAYLEQASALAGAAAAGGWKSDQGRALLAKIFIITEDYARADSIFSLIKVEAAKSATALNDLGVLSYEKKDWERAANYFTAALQADPQFREARYNLALAKAKLGANAEALALLDEYLKLETDDGWKAAATELQKKLKTEGSR